MVFHSPNKWGGVVLVVVCIHCARKNLYSISGPGQAQASTTQRKAMTEEEHLIVPGGGLGTISCR